MRRAILIALIVIGVGACSSESGDLEAKANTIMEENYGACFAPIYDGDLAEASVVHTADATDGVVTVEVFLTTIGSGRDTTYEFRVNTGLGDYKGTPNPGAGIPTNAAAVALVTDCV